MALSLKLSLAAFGVVFFPAVLSVAAQPPSMVPPGLQREPRNPDEAAYRNAEINRAIEGQQLQKLREAERQARESAVPPGDLPRNRSSKETKLLYELLAPSSEDRERYKALLDQPRTGMFKMYPDADCVTKSVVRVDGECANHIPEGSLVSFRSRSLTPDLHYNHGQLVGYGFFSQNLIVKLGDIAVEGVGLTTPGMRFLTQFAPAEEVTDARLQDQSIAAGINHDGFEYADRSPVTVDTTYAMRIVAYRNTSARGFVMRPPANLSPDHFRFGMLYRDNRKDLTVVFRVIRVDEDGSITIVWRELERRKSPELRFRKGEPRLDFRTRSFRGEAFVGRH